MTLWITSISSGCRRGKKGAEELNYLCQSSLSVRGIHLSYHSTFLGLMIRHYLELGRRRKTEVIWLLGRKKKKKLYYQAQLTKTISEEYLPEPGK